MLRILGLKAFTSRPAGTKDWGKKQRVGEGRERGGRGRERGRDRDSEGQSLRLTPPPDTFSVQGSEGERSRIPKLFLYNVWRGLVRLHVGALPGVAQPSITHSDIVTLAGTKVQHVDSRAARKPKPERKDMDDYFSWNVPRKGRAASTPRTLRPSILLCWNS